MKPRSGNDFYSKVDEITQHAKAKREKDLAEARKKGAIGRWLSGFSEEELKQKPATTNTPVAKPVSVKPTNSSASPSAASTPTSSNQTANTATTPTSFWKKSLNSVSAFFSEDAKQAQRLEEKQNAKIKRDAIAAKYSLQRK